MFEPCGYATPTSLDAHQDAHLNAQVHPCTPTFRYRYICAHIHYANVYIRYIKYNHISTHSLSTWWWSHSGLLSDRATKDFQARAPWKDVCVSALLLPWRSMERMGCTPTMPCQLAVCTRLGGNFIAAIYINHSRSAHALRSTSQPPSKCLLCGEVRVIFWTKGTWTNYIYMMTWWWWWW